VFLTFAFIFSYWACTKSDLCEDCPKSDPIVQDSTLKWQIPLCAGDTSDYSSMEPLITQYGVIFSNDFCPPHNKLLGGQVLCLDRHTGEPNWGVRFSKNMSSKRRGYYQDKLWIYSGGNIVVVDLKSGTILKELDIDNAYVRARSIEDYLYFSTYNKLWGDTTYLLRLSLESFSLDTLDILHPFEGGYAVSPTTPSLYIDPTTRDSILIYGSRPVKGNRTRFDVFAFNLQTREVEWVKTDLDLHGTPYHLIIERDMIIAPSSLSVFAMDVNTGDMIWQRDDIYYTNRTGAKVVGELLFLTNNFDDTYGLNIRNGSTVWHNPEGGYPADPTSVHFYNGYLWMNIAESSGAKIMKWTL
jgi:outer membrane protein assembly factor BamB